MIAKKSLLAAALAGAFLPALAAGFTQASEQGPAAERGHGKGVVITTRTTGLRFSGHKAVKNAPYSAEMISERVQVLADGNQIASRRVTMSYRDSQGRTRYENRDDKGELAGVTIQDPVAGVTYALDPHNKTATRFARADSGPGLAAAEAGRAAADAARAHIEQLRKEGKLPAVERRQGADGEEIVIKRFEVSEGNGEARRERRIEIGPMLAGAFADRKWSGNTTTKDLGTREFDGVKAQGKLHTYEIPAGAIGNRNPIVVTDEHWYAPDLQVTVYTKHNDPRSGEVVYRLEKVRREEPQAALFAVPADYTVKDLVRGRKADAQEKVQDKAQ